MSSPTGLVSPSSPVISGGSASTGNPTPPATTPPIYINMTFDQERQLLLDKIEALKTENCEAKDQAKALREDLNLREEEKAREIAHLKADYQARLFVIDETYKNKVYDLRVTHSRDILATRAAILARAERAEARLVEGLTERRQLQEVIAEITKESEEREKKLGEIAQTNEQREKQMRDEMEAGYKEMEERRNAEHQRAKEAERVADVAIQELADARLQVACLRAHIPGELTPRETNHVISNLMKECAKSKDEAEKQARCAREHLRLRLAAEESRHNSDCELWKGFVARGHISASLREAEQKARVLAEKVASLEQIIKSYRETPEVEGYSLDEEIGPASNSE